MTRLSLLLAGPLLLLGGCVTYHVRGDGIARAGLGETVRIDGPRVTPLEVLEDSRCPMNARCVWAGQVRLKVRIRLGTHDEERELTSGKPVPVADGSLELVEVQPDRVAGEAFDAKDYRFGFRFTGGL
jgi:hypothetical protein